MPKNKLRRVLESEGISQSQLARVSCVSVSTIHKVINHKGNPTLLIKHRIVNGLKHLAYMKYNLSDIFPES